MIVKIIKAGLTGIIKAIPAKSVAHRLLIGAALADQVTKINCRESSADIDATVDCLNALCARVERLNGQFRVTPRKPSPGSLLRCGESGTTFRFLLPVACALGTDSDFILSGRLPGRPMAPLYNALEAHAIEISGKGTPFISATGRLNGGEYGLPGNVSSQFISGLMFALPLLAEDSAIKVTGELESKGYIELTVATLAQFGIIILKEGASFRIPGNQSYLSPGKVTVEGDWSNAAFWLAAAAIGGGPVTCTGLNAASLQYDKAVIEILGRFGAQVEQGKEAVTVRGGTLMGITLDVKDIPDLVPVVAAVAALSRGQTRLIHAERLRFKESDRLESIARTLNALGGEVVPAKDGLTINGKAKLHGGKVNACGDHRIAMLAAIAACGCDDPVVIEDGQVVNKSYPNFFNDFRKLGGVVEREG